MAATNVPPLPKPIGDSDLVLDLYTHRSLVLDPDAIVNEEYGNALRLEALGESILRLVVMNHMYQQHNPLLSQKQIETEAANQLSAENMVRWLDGYSLRSRIRSSPQQALDQAEVAKQFMHTYVGAIYIRNGLPEVQDWISKLISPDSPPATINLGAPSASALPSASSDASMDTDPPPPSWSPPPSSSSAYTSPSSSASYTGTSFGSSFSNTFPAQPSTSPPPMPPPPPPGSAAYKITLALINQVASQRGFQVSYVAQSQGPSHAPLWHAQCLVNGTQCGVGSGKTQKIAKEEAAEGAWRALGW